MQSLLYNQLDYLRCRCFPRASRGVALMEYVMIIIVITTGVTYWLVKYPKPIIRAVLENFDNTFSRFPN